MDRKLLGEILDRCTRQFRKGKVIERIPAGTRVTAMPHVDDAPKGLRLIDVHYFVVGVDQDSAEACRDDLVALLADYPDPEKLRSGPSYITVGAHLGDQAMAFRLFALGEVLGLWKLVTPALMKLEGEMAEQAAGNGFIMITGYPR